MKSMLVIPHIGGVYKYYTQHWKVLHIEGKCALLSIKVSDGLKPGWDHLRTLNCESKYIRTESITEEEHKLADSYMADFLIYTATFR